MKFSAILPASMLPAVYALGINCRGSATCPELHAAGASAPELRDIICSLPSDSSFGNGEHIVESRAQACVANGPFNSQVCHLTAFLQNVGDQNIAQPQLCQLAKSIVEHNCKACGSAPLVGNDVKRGELTFNGVIQTISWV